MSPYRPFPFRSLFLKLHSFIWVQLFILVTRPIQFLFITQFTNTFINRFVLTLTACRYHLFLWSCTVVIFLSIISHPSSSYAPLFFYWVLLKFHRRCNSVVFIVFYNLIRWRNLLCGLDLQKSLGKLLSRRENLCHSFTSRIFFELWTLWISDGSYQTLKFFEVLLLPK